MRYVVAISLLLWSTSLHAKEIDLSTRTDATGTYDIAFCSRPSPQGNIPGHMFVSYSHVDPEGNRDFTAIGHTINAGVGPVSATWSYFGDAVGGHLAEEKYTHVKQNCLSVRVNKEDFDKSRALADNPLKNIGIINVPSIVFESYKLGEKDCMSFAISVAQVLQPRGLKIPPRGATELPIAYMSKFIAAN